jgi:hypothetical protein
MRMSADVAEESGWNTEATTERSSCSENAIALSLDDEVPFGQSKVNFSERKT